MLGTNHTPWYPPYENTSTTAIVKQTANFHADLTPYIKSYAYVASKTGLPIIRALFLEAASDEKVWEVADAYFFGDYFYVAPVVATGGTRSVYFPQGASKKYLEYFSKQQVYAAGTTHNISVPLTSTPLFVKQGAIIVRGDVYQGNAKWIPGWKPSLTIELYPSYDVPESRFVFWDGEGDEGKEVVLVMKADPEKQTVSIDLANFDFPGANVVWYLQGAEEGTRMSAASEGGEVLKVKGAKTLF